MFGTVSTTAQDPTEFVPTGVSLDEVAANPVESPKEHVANVQAPWSGSVSTTAQDSSEFVPTDVSLDEVVANSAAESPKKDVGSVAWCVVHGCSDWRFLAHHC